MALMWWVIGVIAILVVLFAFKSQDIISIYYMIRKYLVIVLLIGVVVYLVYAFYVIYATYDLDITSFDGIIRAGKIYFSWFESIFANLGKISGYAVRQDWVLNATSMAGK